MNNIYPVLEANSLNHDKLQKQPLFEHPTETVYHKPQLIALGSACELMRNDGSGKLRDGSQGGWWVWGS